MDFPAFALCLPIFTWTDSGIVASKVLKIVDYFCTKSIPHNLFWTLGTHSDQQTVRIYIFPRNNMTDKNSNSFNVALCELGGYFPVGGWYFFFLLEPRILSPFDQGSDIKNKRNLK